jgi:beta-lactamase class A
MPRHYLRCSTMYAALVFLAFTLGTASPEASPPTDVNAVVEQALAKLPGHSGFLFCELEGGEVRELFAARADEKFAVGSTFKLFILGTLAEEVNADRRSLDNVMLLEKRLEGPPSSEMANWPVGSPVTLNTLALKMISISDNTATDHLLYLLGRERVEQQMKVMGHAHPEWNLPLLSTRDMVELRNKKLNLPGKEYNQLDEAVKRKFLADHYSGMPNYDAVDFDTAAYDVAEWYATPKDMAKALAWLKANTSEDEPAHLLRAILAVDPKLPHDKAVWPYVGFKGGSEDQLLAGNWLLQNKSGRWYTMSLYWNNPDGKADEKLLIEALGTIFAAVERGLK